MRACGECEGRATCRQDTCIGRIAVLKANEVDALAFVPFRSSGGRRTADDGHECRIDSVAEAAGPPSGQLQRVLRAPVLADEPGPS
jgi:hypothetical protein